MNRRIIEDIVCPVDGGSLELIIFSSESFIFSDSDFNILTKSGSSKDENLENILNGILLNPRKKFKYPIYNGIPRLLTFHHSLLDNFNQKYYKELKVYEYLEYPNERSFQGDLKVLSSFSNEWTDYGYSEEAYWGQSTRTYNESLYLTLDIDESSEIQKILEVGIGSGGTSNFIKEMTNAEVFGIDLSYSVDIAYNNFSSPFFHPIQASVFQLPFQPAKFDFVYSHGVLHHTYSTREAFKSISKMPDRGSKLYIWVYSQFNEERSLPRRIFMTLEKIIRPWLSKANYMVQNVAINMLAPLYILNQSIVRLKNKNRTRYGFREAKHAARDRFTPLYIFRHTENEVSEWFKEEGFKDIKALSDRNFPSFVPIGFYANTGVSGVKK